jgi:hypothetical protein
LQFELLGVAESTSDKLNIVGLYSSINSDYNKQVRDKYILGRNMIFNAIIFKRAHLLHIYLLAKGKMYIFNIFLFDNNKKFPPLPVFIIMEFII